MSVASVLEGVGSIWAYGNNGTSDGPGLPPGTGPTRELYSHIPCRSCPVGPASISVLTLFDPEQ